MRQIHWVCKCYMNYWSILKVVLHIWTAAKPIVSTWKAKKNPFHYNWLFKQTILKCIQSGSKMSHFSWLKIFHLLIWLHSAHMCLSHIRCLSVKAAGFCERFIPSSVYETDSVILSQTWSPYWGEMDWLPVFSMHLQRRKCLSSFAFLIKNATQSSRLWILFNKTENPCCVSSIAVKLSLNSLTRPRI